MNSLLRSVGLLDAKGSTVANNAIAIAQKLGVESEKIATEIINGIADAVGSAFLPFYKRISS